MLDFTSSCYLSIDHSSVNLKPWSQLTTGKPAALYEPKDYRRLANRIAHLQGMEAGAIAKSTLHLFWDLFGILGRENFIAFVDAEAYPIAQSGLERFAGLGNDVIRFKHHHPGHLRKAIQTQISAGQRPLIVTDGWCTHCGEMAPLQSYLACARAYNGLLIVDDTQALGIFGASPTPEQPYGVGGGGSLQCLQINGPDIILISSLAKGFGVPIAVLSGNEAIIDHFREVSETRVHSSPPSHADIRGAEHALYVNEREGDQLRRKLLTLIRSFKNNIKGFDIETTGYAFPLQKIEFPQSKVNSLSIYSCLAQSGIKTIPVEENKTKTPAICFAINLYRTINEIHIATQLVKDIYSRLHQRL